MARRSRTSARCADRSSAVWSLLSKFATTRTRACRKNRWSSGRPARSTSARRRRNRHYLNDRREPGWLTARFRIRIALRDVRLKILDRHARREGHRVFVELADVELVGRRHFVHQLASLLQRRPVVVHKIDEGTCRAEQIVPLAAAGVVRRDELSVWINRHTQHRFSRCGFPPGL